MEPTLRPADPEAPTAACPAGHIAAPAGLWQGRPMEVVYDPSRHDVAFVREAPADKRLAGQLRSCGYQRVAGDGASELWVRDRAVAATAALERAGRSSVSRAGLGIA